MDRRQADKIADKLAEIHKSESKFRCTIEDLHLKTLEDSDLKMIRTRLDQQHRLMIITMDKNTQLAVCSRAEFEEDGGIIMTKEELEGSAAMLDFDPEETAKFIKYKIDNDKK